MVFFENAFTNINIKALMTRTHCNYYYLFKQHNWPIFTVAQI